MLHSTSKLVKRKWHISHLKQLFKNVLENKVGAEYQIKLVAYQQ